MGLLEQALSDVGHHSLVFSDLGWNSYESAKFWRKVDILSFLSNFEKWLTNGTNFDTVGGQEVVNHVGSSLFISVVEDVVSWVHVPLDLVDLVGTVRAVFGHNDGSFKLSVDKICIMSLASIIY